MNEHLLLSVVIPVYNLEKYIIPCIESVVENKDVSKDSFEVIVVNDGSTDNTQALVEEYIKRHIDFSIYLINQKNQGVSVARNVGLAHARGKFVWFVDGDDAIGANAVANIIAQQGGIVDIIKIGECVSGIVEGYVSLIDQNQGVFLPAYELLGSEYGHGHTTYIWRRQFLEGNNLSYPEGISHNEDYCFLVKALLLAGKAYINLSFQFYQYRIREHSVSRGAFDKRKLEKYFSDKFNVLQKLQGISVQDSRKKMFLQNYINRYVYDIVFELCLRKCPSLMIKNALRQLRVMNLYPMNFSLEQISPFRKCLLNHEYIFMAVCVVYKWNDRLVKRVSRMIRKL